MPDIFVDFGEVMVIRGFGKRLDHGLDVAMEFTAADEADVEFFHLGEDVLVKEAGVHTDNNGNGLAATGANHAHQMANHLFDGVAVV